MRRLVDFIRALSATIDSEAANERSLHPGHDHRATQILLVASVVLTLVLCFCQPHTFLSLFGAALSRSPHFGRYSQLCSLSYWCMTRTLLLALVPIVHIRLLGEHLSDYGLGKGVSFAASASAGVAESPPRVSLRTYLALLLVMLPLVVAMSFSSSFQRAYPFYRQASRSLFDFVTWELEYLSTFCALEFFFRGYLLFGLRRAFGSQAIFVAVLPYCMFHAGKPPAEALASIIAGIVLGTLALASRTIWGGVLLHVGVAFTMDLSALLQRHAMPDISRIFPT